MGHCSRSCHGKPIDSSPSAELIRPVACRWSGIRIHCGLLDKDFGGVAPNEKRERMDGANVSFSIGFWVESLFKGRAPRNGNGKKSFVGIIRCVGFFAPYISSRRCQNFKDIAHYKAQLVYAPKHMIPPRGTIHIESTAEFIFRLSSISRKARPDSCGVSGRSTPGDSSQNHNSGSRTGAPASRAVPHRSRLPHIESNSRRQHGLSLPSTCSYLIFYIHILFAH